MLEGIVLTSMRIVVGGLMGLLGLMSALIVLGQGFLIFRHSRALRARKAQPRPSVSRSDAPQSNRNDLKDEQPFCPSPDRSRKEQSGTAHAAG